MRCVPTALMLLGFAGYGAAQVCSIPLCQLPVQEQCTTRGGNDPQYLNCLARNRREDNRFHQCFQQRLHDCAKEKQEKRTAPRPPTVNVCTVPVCPTPVFEQCGVKIIDAQQDCVNRNKQEETQFAQCTEQRREKCKEEAQGK
jgi:hypothetical protein